MVGDHTQGGALGNGQIALFDVIQVNLNLSLRKLYPA